MSVAVYVDNSMIAWRGRRWCHLTADNLDELHTFAERLGLKREWFQEASQPWLCHYDVTASMRDRAIALGAVEETWQDAARRAIESARLRMLGAITDELERACRSCGCTSENACWHEDLGACSWSEVDLCSACDSTATPGWEHPAVMEA